MPTAEDEFEPENILLMSNERVRYMMLNPIASFLKFEIKTPYLPRIRYESLISIDPKDDELQAIEMAKSILGSSSIPNVDNTDNLLTTEE